VKDPDWLFIAGLVILFTGWCYGTARLVSCAYFQEKLAYQRQLLQSLTRGEKVNG